MRSLSLVVLLSVALLSGCGHKNQDGDSGSTGKPPCQGGYCPAPGAPVQTTAPVSTTPTTPAVPIQSTPGSAPVLPPFNGDIPSHVVVPPPTK